MTNNAARQVVFIQCGRERFVWIAAVDDVLSQLERLQRGSPFPLAVVAVTDLYSEGELYERFKDHQERGGWYRMSDALACFVSLLQKAEPSPIYRTLSPMLQRRLPRTVVAEYFNE